MVEKNKTNLNLLFQRHENIFSHLSVWEKNKEIIKLCDTIIEGNALLYICCSGGPDSMFLTFIILRYRHIVKGQSLSITKILHINHNTSESDFLMQKLVLDMFSGVCEIKHITLSKRNYSETILRKKRWDFYLSSLQENDSLQNVYLCLGHNLNDRIENSFLHFDRGTHLQGIANMCLQQKKSLFIDGNIHTYTCIRPLLSFPKKVISERCDILLIPYIHDEHNFDERQKRIQYRKSIQHLPKITLQKFYNERLYVYDYIESLAKKEYVLKKIQYPSFRDIQNLFVCDTPKNEKDIVALFCELGIYVNMSSVRLKETLKWFLNKKGALYQSGWWFLFGHGTLFLAQQKIKTFFWEDVSLSSVKTEVDKDYKFDIYLWRVSAQEHLSGCTIGFAQEGEMFGSKSFTKRAANKKIPFFRRRSLPIMRKNNKIIGVLPLIHRPWIQ